MPLRILSLGKPAEEVVRADIYLLTERRPTLLPVRAPGWTLERREPASERLLRDLRSDDGMGWLRPTGVWLTHFEMDAPAGTLRYDLAADVTGDGISWEAAGLEPPPTPTPTPEATASATPEPTPSPVTLTPVPTADGDVALVAASDGAGPSGPPWAAAASLAAFAAAMALVAGRLGVGRR